MKTHKLCDDILLRYSHRLFPLKGSSCSRYKSQNRHSPLTKTFFPVSIHGCQLRENMDIRGTSVQTTYVKTTEECAKICSKTQGCDSFWCHTYGGVEKRCHLKRNGKFRKAAYKTGGICSKGRFSNCFPKH